MRLVRETGKPIVQVARDLGSMRALGSWLMLTGTRRDGGDRAPWPGGPGDGALFRARYGRAPDGLEQLQLVPDNRDALANMAGELAEIADRIPILLTHPAGLLTR